ncbi:iron-sulfur cluster repair di-iron protein [Anaerohalosphaera lusitana]|uniref:Iron-sulfur cluster repair di-iron protein n=1 Tax=Anaerohalosphaera lusitana TaxID=1936003 RepID=A0A1U9NI56_9BACT|nr:hemerythrin domain-containing protein [Anaerohalosphaera lusitana]AQT67609.1 iron-sulfur cluster repair di-iron protein [Anaerohalosphaera lusitana]
MKKHIATLIISSVVATAIAGCTCPARQAQAHSATPAAESTQNKQSSDIQMNREAPVKVLSKEHRATEIVLNAAEQEAKNIRTTGKIDTAKVDKIIKFARNFTDRCHHAKEERYLFPALHKAGQHADTIAVVKAEHELGRDLVNMIETLNRKQAAVPGDQTGQLAQHLQDFADLMYKHIEKEDNILWPAAHNSLTAEQLDKVGMGFYTVEFVELGEGFHHKYHQLAMELKSAK